ncbi:MAG: hypothetical protein A4E28_01277 [Methanocella sp. PtaU1.Bin125]|nr:MAG: hypothetical protein A4E28_01277 [Methanocella sp. PtaU1.Bin125]
MEIKINMDEKSGKITAFSVIGEDLNAQSMEQVLRFVKSKFGESDRSVQKPAPVTAEDIVSRSAEKLTIKERLTLFLKYEYRDAWFGTVDVKDRYERQYGEEIKISTVSTYLSRLHKEGFLTRRGNKVERQYRIASIEPHLEGAPVQQPELQSR